MSFKGDFANSTSFSGKYTDELKSGLQKYIRRGMFDKAVLCAVELFRMAECGGSTVKNNMIKRLYIICMEDIGVASLSEVICALNMISKGSNDIVAIISVIYLMCGCKKTRISSHLFYAFVAEEGRAEAIRRGVQIDKEPSPNAQNYFNHSFFDDSIPMSIRPSLIMLDIRCSEKNPNAIYWLYRFLNFVEETRMKIRQRINPLTGRGITKPIMLAWEIISKYLPQEVYHILLMVWNEIEGSRDDKYVLLTAVSAILYSVPYSRYDILPIYNGWKNNLNINLWMCGEYSEWSLDDYVVDKHTMRGKRMKKGIEQFVKEGAVISNEDTRFRSVISDIYDQRK